MVTLGVGNDWKGQEGASGCLVLFLDWILLHGCIHLMEIYQVAYLICVFFCM